MKKKIFKIKLLTLLGLFSLSSTSLLTSCLKSGKDGKSAYEIWLANGHSGTEEDFLE